MLNWRTPPANQLASADENLDTNTGVEQPGVPGLDSDSVDIQTPSQFDSSPASRPPMVPPSPLFFPPNTAAGQGAVPPMPAPSSFNNNNGGSDGNGGNGGGYGGSIGRPSRPPASNSDDGEDRRSHSTITPSPDNMESPVDPKTPVTLHMDDLDVRKALEMLSRQGKVNILVSPGVYGPVTLDLNNVSFDEALQSILDLCNLTARRDKGIIYIYSAEEMKERSVKDQELPIRVYHVNYIKSIDLQKMIKPFLSPKGMMSATPPSEVGIKSDITKTGGDSMAGGEAVIVQDYEPVLKNVDRLVAELDMQPAQVLIEAVLVDVTLNKGQELGVNFGVLGPAGKSLLLNGSGAAINAATGFTPAQMLTAGKLGPATSTGVPTGFAADTQGLKFGFVDNDVTGFIDALANLGKTKILATPRILVLNKQRAEIQLGDRLGYQTLTQTQTSTVQVVQFMNVGTLLRLRPFISTDGMIRMEIHPEKSSGSVIDNIPQTTASECTTNVMVPDGSTIVIGGLMETTDETEEEGIPLLMQIPLIGNLFKHTNVTSVQKELVVLLTPHVWRRDCPAGLDCVRTPHPTSYNKLWLKEPLDAGANLHERCD